MGQERPQGKDLALEMERLYREYRTPMFRIALAILRDEGLAEDAVQDAFLKLMKGRVYFQDGPGDPYQPGGN